MSQAKIPPKRLLQKLETEETREQTPQHPHDPSHTPHRSRSATPTLAAPGQSRPASPEQRRLSPPWASREPEHAGPTEPPPGSASRKDCLAPGPGRPGKPRRPSSALREAFPRAIAEAIMEGRRPEPVVRECVSVFFSDIVGFTSLSSTMDAARVSALLTRLFAKFDALAQLHGVQKLDVIGDAYLAATNVLEDQAADHAARLARFAIDAIAAAAATRLDDADPASPAVRIRVGLHSGPVSVAVVGAHAFKHTVFGDTVNTASRMESTSLPGRIQCSDRKRVV